MRENIKKALQAVIDLVGADMLSKPSQFRGVLADISIDCDSGAIKNLLRIAMCELNAYERLQKGLSDNCHFVVGNIASEMSRKYMIDTKVTQTVIECIAELLGYTPQISVSDENKEELVQQAIHLFTEKKYADALQIFLGFARLGDAEASHWAGYCHYAMGNYSEALDLFKAAALEGVGSSYERIGYCYEMGLGLDIDLRKAVECYTIATSMGDSIAPYSLGECYFRGVYFNQNYEMALYFFKVSQYRCFESATEMVDQLVANNIELPQEYMDEQMEAADEFFDADDYESALPIYTEMAHAGCSEAMLNLGFTLSLMENYLPAQDWFVAAAENGENDALLALARMYEKGLGVEIDLKMAFEFYEVASETGSHNATFQLGCFYEEGLYVQTDLQQALKYYEVAKSAGNTDAVAKVDEIKKKLDAKKPKNAIQRIEYSDGGVYEGKIVNNQRHGWGKYTFPSGSVFEGEWVNGMRTGYGKYTWANGNVYTGNFVNDNKSGRGTFRWATGDEYSGDWKNDNMHGYGRYTYASGSVYEGDWVNDKRTGIGKNTFPSGSIYIGEYLDGKSNGYGVYFWKTGNWDGDVYYGCWVIDERTGWGRYVHKNGKVEEGYYEKGKFLGKNDPRFTLTGVISTQNFENGKYEGNLSNNKKHGRGKYTWKSGNYYIGNWVNDKKNGIGKFVWSDNSFYVGDWIDDFMTGKGMYVFNDGGVYVGDVNNDKRTGRGRYFWTDGDIYEGDYIESKRTGKGKYLWSSGAMYIGDFIDGKRAGRGRHVFSNGDEYIGDYVDGEQHGRGIYIWGSGKWYGDSYDGEWVKNARSGRGKYIYADGRVDEGYFDNGVFKG
jgi:TPR repeat protein